MTEDADRRLNSWKKIARYLGRDVRTVMRWEKGSGMPVHRVPGEAKGRSVFAYTDELDSWLVDHETDARSSLGATLAGARRPRVMLGAGLLAVMGSVALWQSKNSAPPRPIARLETANGHVIGVDVTDQVAWTYQHSNGPGFFSDGQIQEVLEPHDGADRLFLLTGITISAPDRLHRRGELLAFTSSGELRWKRIRSDTYRFGEETFSAPWIPSVLNVHEVGGERRIAWAVHHYTWWPSTLFLLDQAGDITGQFVNSGWITTTEQLSRPEGDLLLVGGISNSRSGAMLAVLDFADVRGRSPETPGSEFECLDCPSGDPVRYFVFPRTDVNRANGLPYNHTASVEVTDQGVNVTVREGEASSDVVWVYQFSHGLELDRVTPGDTYWPAHRLLELEGKIDHTVEACPERVAPPILSWTPEGGWGQVVAARH